MTETTSAIDECIAAQMQRCHIPGLSLAIVHDGRIVKTAGYGWMDKDGKRSVTSATLFQAASLSKPVAALAVVRLAADGRLSLDEDVNRRLESWALPENEFTREEKVTLRRILTSCAGLTVGGFPGYVEGQPIPTLVQVLDGMPPANTPAIRVDFVPGSQERYSGGGFTLMQKLILDLSVASFPRFMRETVLLPLGMRSSTYEQPLPSEKEPIAAVGYHPDGNAVKGRWHTYPEMAAAGLWTTPSDLARYIIGIQKACSDAPDAIISQHAIREMLGEHGKGMGLGVGLESSGPTLRFFGNGRNEGFDSTFMAYADMGRGAVIMINTNDNTWVMHDILRVIGQEYEWPDFRPS
ncbi:serine hydrolase domain-containing protein [Verrucomicrobiota bacterium]